MNNSRPVIRLHKAAGCIGDYMRNEKINLSNTAKGVIASFREIISYKEIHYQQIFDRNVIINSDEDLVREAIWVLVENAVSNTNDGGYIKAFIRMDNTTAQFEIGYSEKSISYNVVPDIFDRYTCDGDTGIDSDSPGPGSDIASARQAMEKLGGHASICKSGGDEVLYSLEFPL
ncbi:MAG: hypothetical protein FWG30_10220 [Eubacteriaceae bacterium]|nr:hypothetical protein [Eubacteriaceae bacterium]